MTRGSEKNGPVRVIEGSVSDGTTGRGFRLTVAIMCSIVCCDSLTSTAADKNRGGKKRTPVSAAERKAFRYFKATRHIVGSAGPFRAGRVTLRGTISETDWQNLARLKSLTALSLNSKDVTDADLALLGGLKQLSSLGLSDCPNVKGPGLVHLKKLPALRWLGLPIGFRGSGLQYLKDLDQLTSLSAHIVCTNAAGELTQLKELGGLQSLTIRLTGVDDNGFAPLGALKQLKRLDLGCGHQVTDAGLAHLAGLTKLESLNLYGASLTDAGLVHLKRMNRLETLQISYKINGSGLKHLTSLKRLRKLWISGIRLKDEGLRHIGRMSNLVSLTLYRTRFTKAGMAHLQKLARLRYLDLSSSNITDAGLANLVGLPKLHFLDISKTAITDAGLIHLEEMETLRRLNPIDTGVTERGKKRLKRALPKLGIDIDAPP
ncbi:MAG: hypothetical protein IID45_04785 [Planctomycetes bacterium]|nr:hypothetical protein [Planctomycetota bacterium]